MTSPLPFNGTVSDNTYTKVFKGEEDIKLTAKFVMIWKGEILQNNEMNYDLDKPKFEFRQEQELYLFSVTHKSSLTPTQCLIRWVPGPLSLREKRQGREDAHTPSSIAKVNNDWSYTSISLLCFQDV
jgi:hypothetical protein